MGAVSTHAAFDAVKHQDGEQLELKLQSVLSSNEYVGFGKIAKIKIEIIMAKNIVEEEIR